MLPEPEVHSLIYGKTYQHMSDNQSDTLLYPSVVLYAVDSIGTPIKAEGGPVRVPIAAPGQTDTPDLVIVTGPLGQPVAKSALYRLRDARQTRCCAWPSVRLKLE